MSARLVFLGRLADRAGASERTVPPGPLELVLAALDSALAIELLGDGVRMALNGTVLNGNAAVALADGDELAFLPPVSGG